MCAISNTVLQIEKLTNCKKTQEALSTMASETDLDYSYVTKQMYQGEFKEFEKDIKVEIKEEIESESEEDTAAEIEIDIKEEKYDLLQEDKLDLDDTKPSALSAHNTLVKEEAEMILEKIDTDSTDSCLEEKEDVTDFESSTFSRDDTPLTSTMILKDTLQREVRIILEKIDIETPSRKRISNEVPQRAKRIKLEETTKDKNDLANAVLKTRPNNKCKASVRSPFKKTSVYTNMQNSKSKPDTKSIPNYTLVDKIAPKINSRPKDNNQTENFVVQNNKTLSPDLCYNDAENEILKRSLSKRTDAVATTTSIDVCGQENTSYVFNRKGPENTQLCHTNQHKCVPKNELNNHPPKHSGVQLYARDVSDYGFSLKANSDNQLKNKHAKKNNFSCYICQYKCVKKSDLNRHLLKHTGEKRHMCDFCDYRCSSKKDLKRHVTYKHTKEKNFSCHICQFKCVEKSVLNIHLRKHIGEKPYICDFCDYTCVQKNMLISHIKYKHTREKNFKCDICQFEFVDKSHLNRHLLKHTGEKPYICDLCDFRCSRKSFLKSHILCKHTKEKKFSCHICQYKCIEKSILNKHLRKHTGEKPHICDLCDFRCFRKSDLKRHVTYKHTKEKNFSCNICQYKCIEKGMLNKHLRKHTGEKPYICDFCDYRCAQKHYLKIHIKNIHTKEKNFSCHICQFKCVAKGNLDRHLLIHTGEKPYICDFCDFRCVQKNALIVHIKYKHTKEKNFSCHICQYKCVEKGSLNRHLLKHTGKKPHICDFCDFKCSSKSDLKRHVTCKHTKEKNFSYIFNN